MKNDLFYRDFQLERGLLDEKARSAPVVFSSENPVKRWFGSEILLHGERNVDMKRIRSVGAALLNHNPNTIIGTVSNARVEDKKGKSTIVFDDDDEGNRAMGKVKSGSLRGVSVGYRIIKFREIQREEEWTDKESGRSFKGPAMVATRWEPVEISLTPVPADTASKVGRDLSRSLDGIQIERSTQKQEKEPMEKTEVQKMIDDALRGLEIPKTEDIVGAVRAAIQEDAKPKLAMPVERAQEVASQAAAVSEECQREIQGMVLHGKTENECLREINKALAARVDGGDAPPAGGGNFQGSRGQGKVDFEKIDDDEFAEKLRNLDDLSVE